MIRCVFEINEVELDVLASRDVADPVGIFFRQVREANHLLGAEDSQGNLDPLHLNAALPLAVDPITEPGLEKDLFRHLSLPGSGQLGLETVDFITGFYRQVCPTIVGFLLGGMWVTRDIGFSSSLRNR